MASIIVIEDDADFRSLLRQVLEHAGHEVREAADGGAGLALHRDRPADLVVTDLYMPEKDGIETILELREAFPDVRILAVSGAGHAVSRTASLEDARLLGADAVLAKPFGLAELREAVKGLVCTKES